MNRAFFKSLLLFCLFLFGVGISRLAQAAYAPNNITSEFRNSWNSVADAGIESELMQLRDYQVIFIKGFLSDEATLINLPPAFLTQQKILADAGVDTVVSPIGTSSSMAKNAEIIALTIQSSKKPVLLFSYSKGSLDAVEALRLHPELMEKVHGWWMVQSPMLGTPLADHVENHTLSEAVADFAMALIGGDDRAVEDMTVQARRNYFQENAVFLTRLVQQIPIISFASWKNFNLLNLGDTIFALTRDFILAVDSMDNDGLVPWKSEVFPGSEYIAIEGLDHTAAVHGSPNIRFDRARFSKTMYSLLTKRIRPLRK